MANSIRTPRQGVTVRSKRIAQAVDNEDWQEFRKSLKGVRTAEKLDALEAYWKDPRDHTGHTIVKDVNVDDCDICIRVDNYLKALMRGGQLTPFLNLSYFVHCSPKPYRKWRDCMTTETIDGLRRKVSVIRK